MRNFTRSAFRNSLSQPSLSQNAIYNRDDDDDYSDVTETQELSLNPPNRRTILRKAARRTSAASRGGNVAPAASLKRKNDNSKSKFKSEFRRSRSAGSVLPSSRGSSRTEHQFSTRGGARHPLVSGASATSRGTGLFGSSSTMNDVQRSRQPLLSMNAGRLQYNGIGASNSFSRTTSLLHVGNDIESRYAEFQSMEKELALRNAEVAELKATISATQASNSSNKDIFEKMKPQVEESCKILIRKEREGIIEEAERKLTKIIDGWEKKHDHLMAKILLLESREASAPRTVPATVPVSVIDQEHNKYQYSQALSSITNSCPPPNFPITLAALTQLKSYQATRETENKVENRNVPVQAMTRQNENMIPETQYSKEAEEARECRKGSEKSKRSRPLSSRHCRSATPEFVRKEGRKLKRSNSSRRQTLHGKRSRSRSCNRTTSRRHSREKSLKIDHSTETKQRDQSCDRDKVSGRVDKGRKDISSAPTDNHSKKRCYDLRPRNPSHCRKYTNESLDSFSFLN